MVYTKVIIKVGRLVYNINNKQSNEILLLRHSSHQTGHLYHQRTSQQTTPTENTHSLKPTQPHHLTHRLTYTHARQVQRRNRIREVSVTQTTLHGFVVCGWACIDWRV